MDFVEHLQLVIETYSQQNEFMGTVLVAQDDNLLFSKGYGQANMEWHICNNTKTIFRLGSLTKQFTAAAIMLLEERGLLQVEDYISKHLSIAPAHWNDIKVFNLLNHTHGIPNYTHFPEFRAITTFALTPLEQIQLFIGKPLDFEPGTNYCYNNSGYVLLGYIIEQLTGKTYEEFIQENIFTPLNMHDSGYDSFSQIIPHRAYGYNKNNENQLTNAKYLDMSLPYAAGSLYSSVEDLWKWNQILYNLKLISASSLEKMTKPFKENYGFGLEIKQIEGINVFTHTGGINGFHSSLIFVPSTKITIVVLSNLNTVGYVWDIGFVGQNIALKALDLSHNKQVKLSQEKTAIIVDVKILKQYVGEYKIKPDLTLKILLKNQQLHAEFSNHTFLQLYAETEKKFYTIIPELELTFTQYPKGVARKICLRQSGYEVVAEKIT